MHNNESPDSDQELIGTNGNDAERNVVDLIHNNFENEFGEWHSQAFWSGIEQIISVTILTISFPNKNLLQYVKKNVSLIYRSKTQILRPPEIQKSSTVRFLSLLHSPQ